MFSVSTTVAMFASVALVFALTRRWVTSLTATFYLLLAVLISSWVKQAHLGVALTIADLNFFFLRPAENFKLFLNYPNLGLALIGLIAGFVACIWIGVRYERASGFMIRPTGRWLRLGAACAAIVVVGASSFLAAESSYARANNGDSYNAFLAMYEMQNVKGPIERLNVFFKNRSMEADIPARRDQQRFSNQSAQTPVVENTLPDIMLVLEESAFDPRLIRECPPALCDFALLQPLAAATRIQQGPLLVHTTGGGTWLAEFAVLAGFDWRVFGRGGAYAPVSLAPRLGHSLPRYLQSLGYRTVAVYPTDGHFLSATLAYEHYGFDEFYDRSDLKLGDDWPAVYDRMVFDKTLQLAAKPGDSRPVFVFVLTIRNHGPHGTDEYELPNECVSLAKKTDARLADFMARMRDSSHDYIALSAAWLSNPRPRVLAWFGDHQPEAAWGFTADLQKLNARYVANNALPEHSQYLTYFQLAANFGAPVRSISQQALDMSYLGAELLEFSGLPLDANAVAARQVASVCNGLMLDCADRELIADYLSYRIHDLRSIQ
jgi:hypothetical protein